MDISHTTRTHVRIPPFWKRDHPGGGRGEPAFIVCVQVTMQ